MHAWQAITRNVMAEVPTVTFYEASGQVHLQHSTGNREVHDAEEFVEFLSDHGSDMSWPQDQELPDVVVNDEDETQPGQPLAAQLQEVPETQPGQHLVAPEVPET